MHPTSSILHSLKDQIRTVKYSIRAEAHAPGSMLPRVLQSRDIKRLTSLGSVVSVPAFRLADGIVTRVETIAMDLLGASPRADTAFPEPVGAYLADGFDFTDKAFQGLKRIVAEKGTHNVFVSEQALDAAWASLSATLAQADQGGAASGAGGDPVKACALLAHALIVANPVRQVGFQTGQAETHFTRAPSLYCGILMGLLVAVATCRPEAVQEGEGLVESVGSAVNARFDRFRRAVAGETAVDAIASEYRKMIPFLP